jgi:hypothetical protein
MMMSGLEAQDWTGRGGEAKGTKHEGTYSMRVGLDHSCGAVTLSEGG